MDRVRLGYVKYLNTLPLVEGLSAWDEVELLAAAPAKLADLLTGTDDAPPQIDLGLVSLVDAARAPAPLTLVPAGCIGCDGPTLTVRLFSAEPFERVRAVHVDTDSHTSVVLAQLVLQKRFNARVRLIDFDARERVVRGVLPPPAPPAVPDAADPGHPGEWPTTLLMIGDKVVTDSPPAVRYPHQLDLGEAWKEWTGLPFVYAVWMCRDSDSTDPAIRNAAGVLDRQRRRNLQRLDWIIERYAHERAWPEDLARRYVGTLLRYEVGPREREGIARFFFEAAQAGLLPPCTPRWMDEL